MAARRLHFIEPMKALSTAPPPHDGNWLYEVKFDGFRVLAIKNGKSVELWSRNQKPLNEKFPAVVKAVARLKAERCMLDGEVCALDDQGRSSFQLLQNLAEVERPIVYYAFDLLFEGAKDLRALPLMERKTHLETVLLHATDPIRPSSFFSENPKEVLAKMKAVGAEGAIAKLKNSRYETGHRSAAWVKIKFHKGQEFVIAGYTLPRKSRKYFGALLLGYYSKKKLIFAGRVGTGFTEKSLKAIFQKLKKLECSEPMVEQVQEPSGRWRPKGWKASDTRWVRPQLVAQIQFTEWTSDGILRHPSFQGLREDKDSSKVVRE
jgi:bifunctional non-homologous end joining protein LigD